MTSISLETKKKLFSIYGTRVHIKMTQVNRKENLITAHLMNSTVYLEERDQIDIRKISMNPDCILNRSPRRLSLSSSQSQRVASILKKTPCKLIVTLSDIRSPHRIYYLDAQNCLNLLDSGVNPLRLSFLFLARGE